MRIDPSNYGATSPEQPSSSTGRTGASAGAGNWTGTTNAATTGANGDSASFSFDPARVSSLTSQALAAPEVREGKVAQLQQAIAGGTFTVDPSQVAGAIQAEAFS